METTSRNYTLTSLEPNQRYVINYYGKNSYGTGPYMPSPVYATTRPEIVVEPWSWTSSNGAATDTQTRNAYQVLQGNRAADDFHHNVWNDFIDKIVEMREAYGLFWTTDSGRFPSASGCKVSAGDTLIRRDLQRGQDQYRFHTIYRDTGCRSGGRDNRIPRSSHLGCSE